MCPLISITGVFKCVIFRLWKGTNNFFHVCISMPHDLGYWLFVCFSKTEGEDGRPVCFYEREFENKVPKACWQRKWSKIYLLDKAIPLQGRFSCAGAWSHFISGKCCFQDEEEWTFLLTVLYLFIFYNSEQAVQQKASLSFAKLISAWLAASPPRSTKGNLLLQHPTKPKVFYCVSWICWRKGAFAVFKAFHTLLHCFKGL